MKIPKEIAIELVNKYKRCLAPYLQEQSILIKSKQCALIAVDEMIDRLMWHTGASDLGSTKLKSDLYYWHEVKNELEIL